MKHTETTETSTAAERADFGTGSVSGNIIRLAVPLTLAQLVNLLYSIVDRIYIGHLSGTSADALTGIGLSLPIITIIMAFTMLFGTGGSPLFAMARGAGNDERAKHVMGNTFSMLLISGVLLAIFFYAFKHPILYAFGASDATYPYANAYISIYLIGTLFVMIASGMNGFINAQGFGTTGMLSVTIGAILNIILDPIFIFLLHLGVRGAAIATVISQFASATWVLQFLTGKKVLITLSKTAMRIDLSLVKEIAVLGLAGFFMYVTNSIVQIACNASLSHYGGDLYVGIMTVLNSIREIINLPIHGLTEGGKPVVSFNYGAKKYTRVKAAIKFMTASCMLFTTAMWLILLLFPAFFIQIFNSDPALVAKGIPAMHVYFFGIFMMSFQFSGQSTFTALGKAKFAVFFSIFRKVIIVLPLTLLLPNVAGLGVTGVFLAEPISNAVGGLASFSTMIATVWLRLPADES